MMVNAILPPDPRRRPLGQVRPIRFSYPETGNREAQRWSCQWHRLIIQAQWLSWGHCTPQGHWALWIYPLVGEAGRRESRSCLERCPGWTSPYGTGSLTPAGLCCAHYLHPAVILQQSHQVTVLADLVLYVPHEGPDAWLVAAIWVPRHSAL